MPPESGDFVKKAKAELVKLDIQKQLTRARQKMQADNLSEQVVHRARFQQMAEESSQIWLMN
ncbi:MAG: hypothetical protein ABIK83_10875 [Candidatus Zixiibacteriota bacterium]